MLFLEKKPLVKKILFVCLGNICRSPAAEAVFKDIVAKKGLAAKFEIDSAGTSGYHSGEPADVRMQQHAKKRGYTITSISRPFDPKYDFDHFDLILAMDDDNLHDLKQMTRYQEDVKKIHLMTDFSASGHHHHVPDPYYGGPQGFDFVLDLLEETGMGLYNYIEKSTS